MLLLIFRLHDNQSEENTAYFPCIVGWMRDDTEIAIATVWHSLYHRFNRKVKERFSSL